MLGLLSVLFLGAAIAASEDDEVDPSVRRAVEVWRAGGKKVHPWTEPQEGLWMLTGKLNCPEGHDHGIRLVGLFTADAPAYDLDSGQHTLTRGIDPISRIGVCYAHPEPLHFEVPAGVLEVLRASEERSPVPLTFQVHEEDVFSSEDHRMNFLVSGLCDSWVLKNPHDVVRVVERLNAASSSPEAHSAKTHLRLWNWLHSCRPGDFIDGYFEVSSIVAIRPDSRDDHGKSEITYNTPLQS